MADVFISYSRKDSDFVHHIHDELVKRNRKIWVDWEDIPLTSNWWRDITDGIEGAETFVCVMSPESVASPICNFEIAHAVQNNKRIVPLMRREVDEAETFARLERIRLPEGAREILADRDMLTVGRQSWAALARHNWVLFTDDTTFEETFERFLTILDTDLEHTKTHTRLLVRALEWERAGRSTSRLLTGDQIDEAEAWQVAGDEKEPQPTHLQHEYILASRQHQRTQSRRLLSAAIVAVVVSLSLAILSGFQTVQANNNANLAATNEVQAIDNAGTATVAQGEAINQAATSDANFIRADAARLASSAGILLPGNISNAEVAALLAIQSLKRGYTREAESTLTQAIPLLYTERSFTGLNPFDAVFSLDGQSVYVGDANAVFEYDVASATIKRTLLFPGETVFKISPSTNRILTAAPDLNQAVAYDLASGQELSRVPFEGHDFVTTWPGRSDIAPDGQEAFLMNFDNRLFQWNIAQNTLEGFTLLGDKQSVSVQYSTDGRYLFLGNIGWFEFFDRQALQMVRRVTADELDLIIDIAESSDGKLLATADWTGDIILWDAVTYQQVRRLTGLEGAITMITFSPDGRLLGTSGTGAALWDVQSGEPVRRFTEQSFARTLNFSPDGNQVIVTGEDGTVRILNALLDRAHQRLQPYETAVAVGVAADEASFYSATLDVGAGRLAKWDLDTGTRIWEVEYGDLISVIAASPDGQQLLTAGSMADEGLYAGPAYVWDASTGQQLQWLASDASCVNYSADGSLLVIGGSDHIQLISATSFAPIWEIDNTHAGRIWVCDFAPDGTALYTGTQVDAFLRKWDVSTGELTGEIRVGGVADMAIAPDGNRVAVATWGETAGSSILVIDNSLRHIEQTISLDQRLFFPVFAPGGQILAGVHVDGQIREWDMATGIEIKQVKITAEDIASGFITSQVAVFGGGDGAIDIFYRDYQQAMALTCQYLFRDLTDEERATYQITTADPTCEQFNAGVIPRPLTVEVAGSQLYLDPQGHFQTHIPANWKTWRGSPAYPGVALEITSHDSTATAMLDNLVAAYGDTDSVVGTVMAGDLQWTLYHWQDTDLRPGRGSVAVGITTTGDRTYTVRLSGNPPDVDFAYEMVLLPALEHFRLLTPQEFAALVSPTPTPQPEQSAAQADSGGVLFRETFDDNRNVWETSASSPFSDIVEGRYVMDFEDAEEADAAGGWLVIPGLDTPEKNPRFRQPYELQLEVSQVQGNALAFGINTTHDYEHYLWLDVAGDGTTLVNESSTASEQFTLLPDETYVVRLQVTESAYRVYIDDRLVSSVPAIEPIDGSIGIGIGPGTIHAEFDNLVVRILDENLEPTATPGTP